MKIISLCVAAFISIASVMHIYPMNERKKVTCSMCLWPIDIESQEGGLKASCKHCFHIDCAQEWVLKNKNKTCPACQKAFSLEESEILLVKERGIRENSSLDGFANERENTECSICLDPIDIESQEHCTKTSCDHCFHPGCIKKMGV